MKKIKLLLSVFFLISFATSAQITVTASATSSTCRNNGTIQVIVTGVPDPIIYGIAKAPYNEPDIISGLSSLFTDLEPGDYFYGYYSGGAFVKSPNTVKVENKFNLVPPTLGIFARYFAYCEPTDPLGELGGYASGGNAPYFIELVNASNVVVQEQNVPENRFTFSNVASGTYSVRATDVCGTVFFSKNTTLKPNVPYTDFNMGTVVSPLPSYFDVTYNTANNVCSGILSAKIKSLGFMGTNFSDITTHGSDTPSFYGDKNPLYKVEIQNESGGFDVYDNQTQLQVDGWDGLGYPLPNDRLKWGIVKVSLTICGITKTNQFNLAQYEGFRIKPISFVRFNIRDDATPDLCAGITQVEVRAATNDNEICKPVTIDITENGTASTQHYILTDNLVFRLDIGKTYSFVMKDGNGVEPPSYSYQNSTTSSIKDSAPNSSKSLFINPLYYTPKPVRDKIKLIVGPSPQNFGKSALVISDLNTSLGLVGPVHIQTISGPSVIDTTLTPSPIIGNYLGLGNNLIPGTYKIRVTDTQCFQAEYDLELQSYFTSASIQNVKSTPDGYTCSYFLVEGEIKITAVGNPAPAVIDDVYGGFDSYIAMGTIKGPSTDYYCFWNVPMQGADVFPFSFYVLAGDYELALTRTDEDFCERLLLPSEVLENTATVPISVYPNFPVFDLKQSGGVICPGNTIGTLTVKVDNSTDTITYFIKKDTDPDFPAIGQSSTTFTGLTAGTYIVKAKTSCFEVIQPFILRPVAQMGDIIVGDNTYCTGSPLNLSVIGLGPLISTLWTLPDNSTISVPVLTINNLTVANNGEYKVTVTTAAGCALSGTITVTVNPETEVGVPVFSVGSLTSICQSTTSVQTGDYSATAPNATSVTYSISPLQAGTIGAGAQPSLVEWNSSFHGQAIITATAAGCGVDKSSTFRVTVTPKSIANDITAEGVTICPDEIPVALTASSTTVTNPVYTWYDSNTASGAIIGTGENLIVSPLVTTTYYIGVDGVNSCENEAIDRKAVTVTVKPLVSLSDIIVSDAVICAGETASITATSPLTNPVFNWYRDSALRNSLNNTPTLEVSPTVTTTYYVTVDADNACAMPPPGKAVTVTVNQLPVATIAYPSLVYCNRGTAVVTQTGVTGGTYTSDAGLNIDALTGEINLLTSTVGNHTVTYSFTDGTCPNTTTASITINQTILPVALADISEECAATVTAPTLTDPCAGTITATSTTVFPITTQGTTIVNWVFDYGNGYTENVNQNVIIKDNTAPVVPVLADVTAECSATPIAPTTTDNCAGTITGTTTTVFPITTQGTTIVTWSFDDGNGNIATANQNVIIKDVTAPVVPVLADVTAECSATPIAPTTTDNCSGTITGTTTTVFPITTQGTTIVTWSFDDGNGNIATANQNIIIKDNTAPVVPILADVNGECSATVIAPTTTDNCSGTITGTTTTVFPITTQGTTIVTWSFDDGNGNSSTANQNVIIKDNTAPVVPVLADITAECSATPIAATTTDNCAGTITGTTTTVFPITTQGTTIVTWSFDDGNGNIATANQNIIIKDNTAPVVPVLADVTAECSATPIVPTTTDNCSGTITGTTTTVYPITTQGTTIVTWSFDDGNGNIATANQNVIVKDVTAPAVPNLVDITAECSATPIAPTTTDNCAGTITGTTTTVFPITTQGTTIVTWSFDDGNGNIATANQNVIIKDVTAPVVPVLADVTAECSATPIAPTTTDNCSGTITGTTTTVFPITTQGTTIVTWTFDDGNGNSVTANQNIIIKDNSAPVVPVLADVNGECSATPIAPTTTDNCAGTITGTTTTVFPITTQGTTIVTWSFDDGNGNIATANQNVIIKDVTAPAVPVLDDVTAEVSATPVTPTTMDNCAGIITGTTTTILPITTQGTTVVIWNFDDGNGNISKATQNVILKDITAPIFPTLADVTAECSASPTAPTTTDNSSATIIGTTTTLFPITTQGTTIVTWSFDDGNGNVSTANQNVIIKDNTAPMVPVLADVTAECAVTPAIPTTTDNCAGAITGTTTTLFPITKEGTTVIIWSFDDGNGNIATANQNVIIENIALVGKETTTCKTDGSGYIVNLSVSGQAPYTATGTGAPGTWSGSDWTSDLIAAGTNYNINFQDAYACNIVKVTDSAPICCVFEVACPTFQPAVIGCYAEIPTKTSLSKAEFEALGNADGRIGNQLCGVIEITASNGAAPTCKGNVTRIYTVIEYADPNNNKIHDNGENTILNTLTCTQTFTIQKADFILPAQQSIIVSCVSEVKTPALPVVSDNCGTVLVPSGPVISALPACNGTVTYTYKFTDCSGNTQDWVYTYTIDNKIPPAGTAPANLTLQCKDDIPPADSNAVTNILGSCSQNVTVTVSDTNNGGTGCKSDPYILTRIFTLKDCTGLTTNLVQTIQVIDTTSPVFVELLPQNRNVDCLTAIPAAVTLTAFDNCSTATVTFNETKVNGNCPGSYQLTRIWTATDACGNTTTHQQLINVNDTTAPVFVGTMPAAVVKADCDTIPAAAVLTATDTCGTARVDFTETRLEGDCSAKYTLERVWTATDDCGNQSSFTQRVNVSCLAEVYNGISPNGDGKNDTFIIKGIDCYPNNNVSIFNRYGVILYEKQGYDNVTDVFEGISNGRTTINKGDKLPTGTYFYIIEYDNGGTKVKKSGYVYVAN